MKTAIPQDILTQHVAVLGKTGSGKTSTAKLAIEQVVAEGARVCILDPIKSDWWGLTSSANGKHAGLPFHILGGPHGHVPLHSAAGKAIADVVASGGLPLSIIDMADFEPGGQARFFVDFAPTLLRKMRGVVYLVVEEAHLFAPKERSGIGAENLSIHWAKTLATAGRSKGVRLVLVTQRTQALHNALLGSCDTLIAHRLTAPADQEPVVKWLKANTSKDVLEEVAGSLSSLKTGEGWICSGEAKLFTRVQFPRISTYDNTATPTGEGETREIKTAAVDADKLRTLIGQAVDEAKADDPRELRKVIADLRKEIAAIRSLPAVKESAPAKTVERFVLKDGQLARAEQIVARGESLAATLGKVSTGLSEFEEDLRVAAKEIRDAIALTRAPAPAPATVHREPPQRRPAAPHRAHVASSNGNGSGELTRAAERKALTVLAQYPNGRTIRQVAILAGYAMNGGGFRNAIGRLRQLGFIEGRDPLAITDAGVAALGDWQPLPTGDALAQHWLSQLDRKAEREVLQVLLEAYPDSLSAEDIVAKTPTGYEAAGGGFRNALGKLKTLELIDGDRGSYRASEELFS